MPTKVHIIKAMIFPVVMYECESWTIKKVEDWRNDFLGGEGRQELFSFLFFFFLLYNIALVLPHINMNPPWVYTCSQSRTPLPLPPAPHHPSGSSQCTSLKHLVSCIEPKLAICFLYDIIHISMPFSQIIPPLPLPQSPLPQTLFYTCVSFAVSHTGLSLPSF